MSQQDQLIEEAVAAYERVYAALAAATEEEWLHLDLTVTQLTALFTLVRSGPTPVGRLAERLGTRLSSASVLVDRLVHAGLVARSSDPDDRRRVLLVVTDRGVELLSRLRQGSVELRTWLNALSPETLEGLTAGLRALGEVAAGRVRFSYVTQAMSDSDTPDLKQVTTEPLTS
jgi:DNA-binding MarR family transcriptional regulator